MKKEEKEIRLNFIFQQHFYSFIDLISFFYTDMPIMTKKTSKIGTCR